MIRAGQRHPIVDLCFAAELLVYQRVLRLPIEWAMMSTFSARVALSSSSTCGLTSFSALVLLDCEES